MTTRTRSARDLAEWRERIDDVRATLDNVEWDLIDARAAKARGAFQEKMASAVGWARALVEDLEKLEESMR
jgi:hypothetical protein